MEQKMKFNDLTRDFLEDFIKKLPQEDKINLKEYIKNNPRTTSSATFVLVKSYIYNTYFKTTPTKEKRDVTFADTLNELLNDIQEE